MHFYTRGLCQYKKKIINDMVALGRTSWTAEYIDSLPEGTLNHHKAVAYAKILRNTSSQDFLEVNSWGEPHYVTSVLRKFFKQHDIDKNLGFATTKDMLKGFQSCV